MSAGVLPGRPAGSPPPPPPRIHARCGVCWVVFGIVVLVVASFVSLDMQWGRFLSVDALQKMGRFIAELLSPSLDPASPEVAATVKRNAEASDPEVRRAAAAALGTLDPLPPDAP